MQGGQAGGFLKDLAWNMSEGVFMGLVFNTEVQTKTFRSHLVGVKI